MYEKEITSTQSEILNLLTKRKKKDMLITNTNSLILNAHSLRNYYAQKHNKLGDFASTFSHCNVWYKYNNAHKM